MFDAHPSWVPPLLIYFFLLFLFPLFFRMTYVLLLIMIISNTIASELAIGTFNYIYLIFKKPEFQEIKKKSCKVADLLTSRENPVITVSKCKVQDKQNIPLDIVTSENTYVISCIYHIDVKGLVTVKIHFNISKWEQRIQ